ncbi:MAG TPA: DNA replication protein, partial [Rhodospirillales bacterium]|nr:DNA replication protein [Rhodospirillales bacterium]
MADICQNAFNFDIRPAVGGQDFLVAFSNQKAVEWFDRWPDWHVPAIIIYG